MSVQTMVGAPSANSIKSWMNKRKQHHELMPWGTANRDHFDSRSSEELDEYPRGHGLK